MGTARPTAGLWDGNFVLRLDLLGGGEPGVRSLPARRMGPVVQQKHFHCGLCYFLFRTPHGSTLGLPGAPHRPSGGAAGHGRALGSRAREGRGRSVSRECRGDFAMLVLLRALFSPLRWRDATWLLRSCCRVERVFFFFSMSAFQLMLRR